MRDTIIQQAAVHLYNAAQSRSAAVTIKNLRLAAEYLYLLAESLDLDKEAEKKILWAKEMISIISMADWDMYDYVKYYGLEAVPRKYIASRATMLSLAWQAIEKMLEVLAENGIFINYSFVFEEQAKTLLSGGEEL
ncbi:MAG: hypothetical protein ACXQS5_03865 [Candidatus Methanospirareceae archaeon]